MHRRAFIETSTAAVLGTMIPDLSGPRKAKKMGVVVASYAIRWRSEAKSDKYPSFSNALDMLEHCHAIGAGGIQVGVRDWNNEFAGKVRDRREALGMYLEGQIMLPKDAADTDRFDKEISAAKEAGIEILRAVCLTGRRYETFDSLKAFKEFKKASMESIKHAEPIVQKHRVKLAIENHKDWRIPEMLDIMKYFDSEWIGVTLDTGNNIALVEDPMEVVETLAPYAFTTHFKDMAVDEYEDGFLLSEVPLGKGYLDLPGIKAVCEQHNPDITINLEMITRDPLKIPCLTKSFWNTFDLVTSYELARTIKMVRANKGTDKSLPKISHLDPEKQLASEESNVQLSFDYARKYLGLT